MQDRKGGPRGGGLAPEGSVVDESVPGRGHKHKFIQWGEIRAERRTENCRVLVFTVGAAVQTASQRDSLQEVLFFGIYEDINVQSKIHITLKYSI